MGGATGLCRLVVPYAPAPSATRLADSAAQVLPLGTVAVGLVRSIPASLLTAAAPPAERGQRASAGHAAEREAAAVTGAAAFPLGAVLGRLDAAGSLCRVLLPPAAGALADGPGLWAAFAAQAALCLGSLACTEWWFRRAQAGQAQERLKAA